MSEYTLDITLSSTNFEELGVPSAMKDVKDILVKDAKGVDKPIKGDMKDDYVSCKASIEEASTTLTKYSYSNSQKFNYSSDTFSLSLPYEQGVVNTYKFMGMDIDEDYNAIIPCGDGRVIVGNLFNRDELVRVVPSRSSYGSYNYEDLNFVSNRIKSMDDGLVRKLSTALKSGKLYECIKPLESDLSLSGLSDITTFKPLVDMFKEDIQGTSGTTSSDAVLQFKSLIMNLISKNVKEVNDTYRSESGMTDSGTTFACIFLGKCFVYWKSIVNEYSSLYAALSSYDLWQNQYKKIIGTKEFNDKVKNRVCLINQNTGAIDVPNVAISGVAKNGSIVDSNIIRNSCEFALSNLDKAVAGSYNMSYDVIKDLMIGCMDNELFDNPYELSSAEVQAMATYDGLKYSDESAKLCMESYDMSNEDERALFIDSAIKSYERNFKEYKPKDDYDVTESLAELVETQGKIKERIIPETEFNGEDTSVYTVTSTGEQLKLESNKKMFYKVAKISNKTLKNILDLF